MYSAFCLIVVYQFISNIQLLVFYPLIRDRRTSETNLKHGKQVYAVAVLAWFRKNEAGLIFLHHQKC